MRTTFKAYERLKREQNIDTLFRKGKAFSVFPVKVMALEVVRGEGEISPVRVGFSAPKKKFRKAVDRNRVKRLLREAWRLHKQSLYEAIPADKQLHLFFLFIGPELPDFTLVNASMQKAIAKLQQNQTS